MTRQSYQQGHVSEPIPRRHGMVFVIRYRVRTSGGRWLHKSETLRGLSGRKAARAVLNTRIRQATARLPEAAEVSLRDFVEGYWEPYLERKGVKPSTRQSYDCAMRRHVLPRLGNLLVADVSPLHIEELLRGLQKLGLSGKTMRNVLALLSTIFALAEDNELVTRSPVRKRHKPNLQHREKPTWTASQIREIISAVPVRYRPFFVCAALTGARLGELLGLQWKHVDWQQQKLDIRQSLWRGQLFSPKTKGSVRCIHFGELLDKALKEQHATSKRTGPDDFIFCKSDGYPFHPDVLRTDVLYPALERLGMKTGGRTSGFHTFRHSAASFINSQTGNLKLAQKLLGHSSIDMTANVYTHTDVAAERGAALALEKAIYGDLFATVPRSAVPVGNDSVQ